MKAFFKKIQTSKVYENKDNKREHKTRLKNKNGVSCDLGLDRSCKPSIGSKFHKNNIHISNGVIFL